MRWLRIDTTWASSDWLLPLGDAEKFAWIQLLCYVKAHGFDGRAKAMNTDAASRAWFISDGNALVTLITAAEKHGAIRTENGYWIIAEWHAFQGDQTGSDRQRRFKNARQVTVDNGKNGDNALVTPTETSIYILPTVVEETQTKPKKQTSPRAPNPAFDPPMRVMSVVHAALGWAVPKPIDVKVHLKPDSPLPVLIAEYGEDMAANLFLHAHKTWGVDHKPTWSAVARQRNQLHEQVTGKKNGSTTPPGMYDAGPLTDEDLERMTS